MKRRKRTQDNEPLAIPVEAIPEIVRGSICGAPSEALAQMLGIQVLMALRAGAEHWQAQADTPAPDPAPELEAIWDAPAWGEEGWQA